MNFYLTNCLPDDALFISVSYWEGNTHKWWISYQATPEGQQIYTWEELRAAVLKLFQSLNKEKLARDKLAKWKQVKDISTLHEDFLKLILKILHIGMDEKIDRYTRGLKTYFWKIYAPKTMSKRINARCGKSRFSAHKRLTSRSTDRPNNSQGTKNKYDTPTPTELGTV